MGTDPNTLGEYDFVLQCANSSDTTDMAPRKFIKIEIYGADMTDTLSPVIAHLLWIFVRLASTALANDSSIGIDVLRLLAATDTQCMLVWTRRSDRLAEGPFLYIAWDGFVGSLLMLFSSILSCPGCNTS